MFNFSTSSPSRYFKRGRDEVEYASLRDGSSSPTDDALNDDKVVYVRSSPRQTDSMWKILVVSLLLPTNFATLFALVYTRRLSEQVDAADPVYTPESWARVDDLPETFERFDWWTEYSDKNFTETDALWDDINPAHGFIAMDREWAMSQHWPKSMHLPSDDSKNVYLLEAYHLVHCVTIIRKTFWEAIHGAEKYTFNPPHAGHCIDMMRQYVMCKADSTPQYIFGDDTAGDEQYRKCNDWNTLKQFATDNSACYRDTPLDVDPTKFALGAHFGYCDGGYDGMKKAERRGPWKHGAVFDGPQ